MHDGFIRCFFFMSNAVCRMSRSCLSKACCSWLDAWCVSRLCLSKIYCPWLHTQWVCHDHTCLECVVHGRMFNECVMVMLVQGVLFMVACLVGVSGSCLSKLCCSWSHAWWVCQDHACPSCVAHGRMFGGCVMVVLV